jgi:hypothetical protein
MKQKKHKNESVGKNTGSFSFLHSFSVLVFRKKKKQKPKILLPATAPRRTSSSAAAPRLDRRLHGVGTRRRRRTWWVVPVREGEDELLGPKVGRGWPRRAATPGPWGGRAAIHGVWGWPSGQP